MSFVAGFYFVFQSGIQLIIYTFNYFVSLVKPFTFRPLNIRKRSHTTQRFGEEKMSQTLIHFVWDCILIRESH